MLAHQTGHPLDDVGMLVGHVMLFPDVGGQIVEFDLEIATVHVLANRFPVADPDRWLAAITGELSVQERPRCLPCRRIRF